MAGKKRFNELKADVNAQWDADEGVEWTEFERKFLIELKAHHKITHNSHEQQAKHKRKKRKVGEGVAEEEEEVVDSGEWSDEE